MRLISTSALSISLLLTVACGSGSGGEVGTLPESDETGSGGKNSTDGEETDGEEAMGGAPGDVVDAAPGELSNIMVAYEDGGAVVSWDLPADEDLDSLSYTLTQQGEKEALDEAIELVLADNTLVIPEATSGTEFSLRFYLTDASGQGSESVFVFTPPGPQPVADLFTLALDGGVYLRWTNPVTAFESIVVRQGDDVAPSSLDNGEEIYAGTGERTLVSSITNGNEYGFLFAALDTEGLASTFRTAVVTPTEAHAVVTDAVAECDNYGYRITTTPWTQTFVRGENGEDVLTGIELELKKTGSPTEALSIRILDKNDDYLWSNGLTSAKIPTGTNWVGLLANGQGASNVPYELLDPGETYKIEVKLAKEPASQDDYYTWRSSTSGDCYPEGEANVNDRDFHFRTIHAKAGGLIY